MSKRVLEAEIKLYQEKIKDNLKAIEEIMKGDIVLMSRKDIVRILEETEAKNLAVVIPEYGVSYNTHYGEYRYRTQSYASLRGDEFRIGGYKYHDQYGRFHKIDKFFVYKDLRVW